MSPATRSAGLGAFFGSFVAALVLYAVRSDDSSIGQTWGWVRGHGWQDSWQPIRLALSYFTAPQTQGFYEATYFNSDAQFIYSPLSLILFEPFRIIYGLDADFIRALNDFSWWVVLAISAVTALILVRSIEIFQNHGAPSDPFDCCVQVSVAVCTTLFFYPIVKGYTLGQVQTWISFLFAAAVCGWLYRWRLLPGALVGLICIIKPQLTLLVVWAAIRREWRFVAGWFAVVVPLGIVSFWLYGLASHIDFVHLLLYLSRRGESYYASHSVNSLLNRLLFNGPNLQWDPTHTRIAYNPFVHAVSTASTLVLIGFALVWRVPGGERARIIDFCIAALSFTMASPIAYEHHYGVLLPIFAVIVPAALSDPRSGRAELTALATAFVLGANDVAVTKDLADSVLNVLQSYLLFGAVILLVLMYRLRRREGERSA